LDINLHQRYLNSLDANLGKEMSKKKWMIEAKERNLDFLCRDIENTNNAWYKLPCNHINMFNRADVRRGKYKCKECQINTYKEACKLIKLTYINHYCENRQTIIEAVCNICRNKGEYRVTSVVGRGNVYCKVCIGNIRKENALKVGFIFVQNINGTFCLLKCLSCNRELVKRFSDLNKGEITCDCKVQETLNQYWQLYFNQAKEQGLTLIKKLDSTWAMYTCNYCHAINRFQVQAVKIGNCRCRNCSIRKARKQIMIETYLKSIGYLDICNEITFDDLYGLRGGKLRYDIGLKEGNTVLWLIEYDGSQHEQPIKFGNLTLEEAVQKFKIQVEHDSIKDRYAEIHGIPLLRISYKDPKELWIQKIHKFLGQ